MEGLGLITGLLDVSAWLGIHIPQLEAIDWLSVDKRLLVPLIKEWPVPLALSPNGGEVMPETMELIDGGDFPM